MARVNVSISNFQNGKFRRNQIATIRSLSERHIEEIARETAKVIQRIINERITRVNSTGNLADSFFALPIPGGWGVGDIVFLNTQAPYWYWQNYGVAQSGRRVPPASTGQFIPGNPAPVPGGSGARWEQPGPFFINPTKAITAKNYIEATIQQISTIVRDVVRRVR